MSMTVKSFIRGVLHYIVALMLCMGGSFIGAVRYGIGTSSASSYAIAMGALMGIITAFFIRHDNAVEEKKANKYMEYMQRKKKNQSHQKEHDVNDAINAIDKIDISHISANNDDDD